MKPVAIVIPWFGKELKGGAEQQAWQIASRLAARNHRVEVLTTCCRSFLEEWSENHLPAGEEIIEDMLIRRFRVDKRKINLFHQANAHALAKPANSLIPGVNPFTFGTDSSFVSENINSTKLERYLKKHQDKYHCFIFIPYLYGISLNGLPLVADKAYLQPCLHHEAYAFHPQVEKLFRLAKGLLYNSTGEEHLALKLFGPGIIRKGFVMGEGVEISPLKSEQIPPTVQGIKLDQEQYILFLGRRDKTKNIDLLLNAYARFRNQNPDADLKLIIAGPGEKRIDQDIQGFFDLELVSDPEKEALLHHCLALFQPSSNESYSRVIMEAWLFDKPVAVHGDCLATSMAVEQADGGWIATKPEQWTMLFAELAGNDLEKELITKGQNGRQWAAKFAGWDPVIDRYEQILNLRQEIPEKKTKSPGLPHTREIHQLTAGFAYGDAISNQAILFRDYLRSLGYKSKIFTEHIDPLMVREAEKFNDGKKIKNNHAIIYHHSIGCGLTDFLINFPGPKGLVYHNITPAKFLEDVNPEIAEKLTRGRQDMTRLAPHFLASGGDSLYNNEELIEAGFPQPLYLPICITPDKWNIVAEPHLMARLQDGKINIIFVGRVIGNKCQTDLIRAFALFRKYNNNSRLFIIGGYDPLDAYFQSLEQEIDKLNLKGDVFFTNKISDQELHAYYRTAHLYWSMSEHEGFGVPLIEAMWFNVPILAYKSSAIPETLGKGGILFNSKDDLESLAVLAHLMTSDQDLRRKILLAQQERRKDFLPESVLPRLDALLLKMGELS